MKKIFISVFILLMSLYLVSCKKEVNYSEIYQNDIYYSLFVRSFADSDQDGIGDLKGVTNNLDYLEDLGVTGIWLLPIFKSPSYHGYDTTDYYQINEEYGTMDDLKELLAESKKRNIKVILDLVINHTSDTHPWYLDAINNKDSEYRDFYVWQNGSAYQSFSGGMVDLNLNSPKVLNEIYKIIDTYVDLGVDGFRLDAVGHFFEESGLSFAPAYNKIFMSKLNDYIEAKNKNLFLVGEVFVNDYNIVKDYAISGNSYFNFYLQNEIKNKVGSGSSQYLLSKNLERMYSEYYKVNNQYVDSPFLGNHDMDRVASMYNDFNRLKSAVGILMTLPGSPFIYYGDEIGLKGVRYEGAEINGKVVYDEYRRQPLLWGDDRTTKWLSSDDSNKNTKNIVEQQKDQTSMFNHYKKLISLRKSLPSLMYGNEFASYENNTSQIQGYYRSINDSNFKETVLVINNLSDKTINLDLDFEVVYGSKELEAFGMVVFKLKEYKNMGGI
jgi:alpha-amylase